MTQTRQGLTNLFTDMKLAEGKANEILKIFSSEEKKLGSGVSMRIAGKYGEISPTLKITNNSSVNVIYIDIEKIPNVIEGLKHFQKLLKMTTEELIEYRDKKLMAEKI